MVHFFYWGWLSFNDSTDSVIFFDNIDDRNSLLSQGFSGIGLNDWADECIKLLEE